MHAIPLANIIFPAPSWVYVTTIFLPFATILALGTEFAIFRRAQAGVTTTTKLFGLVIGLNALSWIVGLFLSGLLPSGYVPRLLPEGRSIMERGPHWEMLAILSYPFACVVSGILEYAGIRIACRRIPFREPLRTVAIANVASYVVLAASVYVSLRMNWI